MEESLGAIKEMKDAGKIRHVGLSNVEPDEIERARKIVPIVSVQNRYNIEDRKSENALVYCEKNHLGFLPWFPIGGTRGLKPENALNSSGKSSWRERLSSRAGLAAGAITRDVADSRDIVRSAPGRKYCSSEAKISSGRMESD